jgi:hypothetical protein
MRTLKRRVDFLKSREHKNSFDLAELSALEWAIINLQPEQKRPQNCGTSYCSCIECVMKPVSVREPVAYLFTNVQSGDIEASTNPDHKEGEREMWYREPLIRPPAQPAPVQEKRDE